MKPGFYHGLSYDDYAALGGIRASDLKPLIHDTPADYLYRKEHPEDPTPAMEFGTAFHTLLLEPERFGEEYVIDGPINPSTRKPYGRDTNKFRDWLAAHPGIEVLTSTDLEKLQQMKRAVMAHEDARKIFEGPGAETEVSIVWQDEVTGRWLQGRLDHWVPGAVIFTDLKTTKDVKPRLFDADAERLGYYMQLAMYWDGVKMLTGKDPYIPMVISVRTSKPPYHVAVRQIPMDAVEHGRQQYRGALEKLSICEAQNNYPAYPGVIPCVVPGWALKRDRFPRDVTKQEPETIFD